MPTTTPQPTAAYTEEELAVKWWQMAGLQRAFFLPAVALEEVCTGLTNQSGDFLPAYIGAVASDDGESAQDAIEKMHQAALAQLACTAAAWDKECFSEFVRMMRSETK